MISFSLFAQPIEKSTDALRLKMEKMDSGSELLVWVFFNDKGNNVDRYYSQPQSVVSEKSLFRREKVLDRNSLINYDDLPVSQSYIDQLFLYGFKIKQRSKWFDGVSGFVEKDQIASISKLSFVKKIDIVSMLPNGNEENLNDESSNSQLNKLKQPENVYTLDYGNSFTQLQQINVPAVHDLGYSGQGVTICVMDAGFNRLSHEAFASMTIIAKWDFVNNDPGVGDSTDMGSGSHGTQTLSTIGGFKLGSLIGPAFGSNFILAKTENTDSETPIEEDNWIAALEWADSIGVDVTSTSLVYLDYNPPFPSYTWENMDGNTARITIAADLAVNRGIVVVNSAGNEGFNSSHNTLSAPADGDSVISVGAVNSSGIRSSFSSVGNTVDGRIKPDVMAMGSGVVVASTFSDNQYTTSSGTSFSCPLAAGVAALILSYNPSLTPMQVRDAMRNTASNNSNPNSEYGWGILNTLSAINSIVPVELVSFTGSFVDGKVLLEWKTSTEKNNSGFEIQRTAIIPPIDDGSALESWVTIGFVKGNGSTTKENIYKFIDDQPASGKTKYRLKQIDFNGNYSFSNEITLENTVLYSYKLFQNYPNPFNPVTTIRYSIPQYSYIKLILYDALGNEVKRLVDKETAAGSFEIILNTTSDDLNLASGIYIVKFTAGGYHKAIKILLTK